MTFRGFFNPVYPLHDVSPVLRDPGLPEIAENLAPRYRYGVSQQTVAKDPALGRPCAARTRMRFGCPCMVCL